jgi:deoxyribonuclease-4
MTASHRPILDYDSSDEYRPEPVPEPQAPAWRDGSVRIGIHTSIADGFAGSLESAVKLGCNALQIFSASPRMWPHVGARIPEIAAAEFRAKRAELGLGPLVIHANYLINLASSDPVLRVRSIQAVHDEMVRGAALGADYLVVHPGSCCGKTPGTGKSSEQGIRDVALAIRQAARGMRLCGAFDDPRDCRLRLLLENTSGMGMAVGSRFEELKAIIDAAPDLPVGICLDTAHAFHAGYGIHTEAGLAETIAALERTVGLSRVAMLHVNDSKTPFGSRVDRHEHIGRGEIGLDGLRRVLNHPKLSASAASGGRPGAGRTGSGGNNAQLSANENAINSASCGLRGRAFLLETPIDAPGDDRRNVRRLWELVGVAAKQAPRAQNGFSMMKRGRAGARAVSARSTIVNPANPAKQAKPSGKAAGASKG